MFTQRCERNLKRKKDRHISGTAEGYQKYRANKIKQYGSEEAWKDAEVRVFGSRGGQASRGGGFASDKVGKDGLTGRERAKLMGKTQGRGLSESK